MAPPFWDAMMKEVGLGRFFLELVRWKHEEEADLSPSEEVCDRSASSFSESKLQQYLGLQRTVSHGVKMGRSRQTDIHGMRWGRWKG